MSGSTNLTARRIVSLLTVFAFVAFTVRPAWAGCSTDTDCKGGRVCKDDVCVGPALTPAAATEPPSATPTAPETGPAQGRRSDLVNMSLKSSGGGDYKVSFAPERGDETWPCGTPCTLQVPAGKGTLKVRGDATYDQSLSVPASGTAVVLRKACKGCYWGGAAVIALGLAVEAVAAVSAAYTASSCERYRRKSQGR